MTEGLEAYKKFGLQHTSEQKKLAAVAGLSFLFGCDWGVGRAISFVAPAADRLIAMADDEAYIKACEEVGIMTIADEVDPELVERGVKALNDAFNWSTSPHSRKYWLEVVRNARMSSGGAT